MSSTVMDPETRTSVPRETRVSTMKAVRIHGYGGPEVLKYEDTPRPEPSGDEVLVRVNAAGVNPLDWMVRQGRLRQAIRYRLPLIPGWDLSGTVVRLGPAAGRFAVGDKVYGRPDTTRDGAYAELITVKESDLARKPRSIDHVHAAAVPLAGLTAWQALFDVIGLAEGQTVLIHGAAGGVGTFAVQLAKWQGANVIGTGSARNHRFLLQLGADEFIDRNRQRFEDAVRDADAVLDTIGGETQVRSYQVLKPGGALASLTTPPSDEEARAHGVRAARVHTETSPDQLDELARLIDDGVLRPVVTEVIPLSEARRAHEMSQDGHVRGKLVLKVGG